MVNYYLLMFRKQTLSRQDRSFWLQIMHSSLLIMVGIDLLQRIVFDKEYSKGVRIGYKHLRDSASLNLPVMSILFNYFPVSLHRIIALTEALATF